MSISGIVNYVLRAVRFAVVVGAVWFVFRLLWMRRRFDLRRELGILLFVVYAAALAEIIALRGGVPAQRDILLIPLQTTLGALKQGLWPFVYHLIGNTVWFVPLGFLTPMLWPKMDFRRTALLGAGSSLVLEILQWVLNTGMTDVDDLIVNTLGACVGFGCHVLLKKIMKKG